MNIFNNWTDEHTKVFRKDCLVVQHKLDETGLFTDEALAKMLDKHPSEKLDLCTMSQEHALYPNKFRTGDFRDCDGAGLIEAAKAGSVWMNVREAMNVHPEYKAVLDDMYGSIAEITGQPPFNARGGILISSPSAKVPYHCDQTETILWHVRGQKRMYLYPATEEFMSDEAYYRIITQDLEDDVPYHEDMDKSAQHFDLEGGEMVSWPLNAPHRVVNNSYCVSVTTEYSSKESAFKNAVMFANAVLHHRLGLNSNWANASMPERYIKSIMGRAFRKLNLQSPPEREDLVTFKLDHNAPGFVVDVDPFVRNF